MKKLIFLSIMLILIHTNSNCQESYGKTFNVGLGIGYYSYVGHSLPEVDLNYEFNVARNFTIAPFMTFYSYRNNYYWGDNDHPYAYYYYKETVIPIGAKGTYYFDELLNAGAKWDFYTAASLGFAIINTDWQDNYIGDRNSYHGASPLFMDLHIGSEYHLTQKLGLFLDLSTGVSTIGLAIH